MKMFMRMPQPKTQEVDMLKKSVKIITNGDLWESALTKQQYVYYSKAVLCDRKEIIL